MNPQDNINSLFDPHIEELCINYINNKSNNIDFNNNLTIIQEEMDQIQGKEKHYAIKDNCYVFKNLLDNSFLKENISNFFVDKYIIIFNYKNFFKKNIKYDINNLKIIEKIKSNETDYLDFDYYFFNFVLKKFNDFICEEKNKIFENYKNECENIYYIILKKIFDRLYNSYYDDIDDELICPISLNIMNKAVKTTHGHIYDKIELTKWLKNKNTCPMTRLELNINDLKEDKDMNDKINEWKNNNIINIKAAKLPSMMMTMIPLPSFSFFLCRLGVGTPGIRPLGVGTPGRI